MQKAQVFLTEDQKFALKALSTKTGRKQSEIIRHGLDLAIAEAQLQKNDWKTSLVRVRGLWKDRDEAEKRVAENRSQWQQRHSGNS